MKIVICDNDLNFLKKAREKIATYMAAANIASDIVLFDNPAELLTHAGEYDLLFLETEFEGYNGIRIGKQLRLEHGNFILVYISNSVKYAPEGYRINAFRYVLKTTGFDKALEDCLNAITKLFTQDALTLDINCVGRYEEKLFANDIVYFHSETGHRTMVVKQKQIEEIYTYDSLHIIEAKVNPACFLRVNRNYLVNCKYIHEITNEGCTILTNGMGKLPTAKRRIHSLQKKLILYKNQGL